MSARRRRSQPRAVGSLLGGVLGELGLETAALAFRISERWAQAVGAEAAAHSRPLGLRGGVLEVGTDSSVWSQQLQLRHEEILAALQGLFGDEAPREMRLRVGYHAQP